MGLAHARSGAENTLETAQLECPLLCRDGHPRSRGLLLLIIGVLWGALAWGLGARGLGPAVWAGVLLSLLIGLAVGALMQPAFERFEGFRRWLVALGTLYLGSTLFGLVVGIAESPRLGVGWSRFPEGILEGVGSVWWGLTLTGFLLVLWPLAYATHAFLVWNGER